MLLPKQSSSASGLVSGNPTPVLHTCRFACRVVSLPLSKTYSSPSFTTSTSSSGRFDQVIIACSSHEASPISSRFYVTSRDDEDLESVYNQIIVGSGQLGRMLCQAASQMAIKVMILDPSENCSASSLAYGHMVDSFDDSAATVEEFAKRCGVLTVEIEHVDVETLEKLEKQGVDCQPKASTIRTIQIGDIEGAERAGELFGYPLMIMSKRLAYDGRGNAVANSQEDLSSAVTALGGFCRGLYVEKWAPFIKELAVIVARRRDGSMVCYPVVETVHRDNICHIVKAPADVPWKINKLATDVAQKAVGSLDGAGVFAVELFLTEDGQDGTLSLVSKHFRSLVASPGLYYARRSMLACTENCLYVALFDMNSSSLYHWYILCRNANGSHCLVRAPSTIPVMSYPQSSVAVGSRIYVFGGFTDMTTNVFCMDCRSHTVEPLPSIPVRLVCKFAGFIDGKIYVIGCCYDDRKNVMVVFDIETQKWEHAMIKPEMEAAHRISDNACVVMDDKIYIKDGYAGRSYVYKPVERKWETDEDMLSYCPCIETRNHRVKNASVVDDVLLYHDRSTYTLRAYDPNEKYWRVVEGLKELLAKISDSQWSRTVNYGGNMALLFRRTSKIWCAEISLERRQGGQIWGKVEWCDHVLTGNFGIRKFLAVTF